MKAPDRTKLTAALRDHVAKIASDLRVKMRAPSIARATAEQLHKDERVAEDFDVWTDLLSRRAAVLWVLKSVYVRVLEDRGLLSPGRLLDPEAQQLFEKLAPNLGETAFLRWIYKDLASKVGGLPELFSPQPAEVAQPSDELSRALIDFWRHRDADTGAVWSFAEEHFEGELMGDLYQELDPVVKDRFALCQTPDFVRAFILDRTLTPALETFGADQVRLLDPACGSGHFLIDGLKRLVAATAEEHTDWSKEKVVTHALDRVVGIDLNDYACALARTRLIMTAAELADVTKLADAARFHPHVYWADGLEQVERDEIGQIEMFAAEKPRASLTRSDVRGALRKVFEKKFHSVVANPPYITEKDAARKDYHREKLGKKPRYVSAYREYSLGSPFTERCFQLAEPGAYVGIITSNNFMKREFGKPLIEKVLAGLDLSLVVDTSQAYIPFHGTPTVLLFGRNRSPELDRVRAVMGKRGESGTPDDPAKGKVWSSIGEGWDRVGFESEYVSVADLPRQTLNKHPWSLGGGGAAELKDQLARRADKCLADIASEIGFVCMTRADDIYFTPRGALKRAGVNDAHISITVEGDRIRDYSIQDPGTTLFPYDSELRPVSAKEAPAVHRWLWPYRTLLWLRREPNGNHREIGLTWWEWSRFQRERFRMPLSIAFAFVATHNHFVLDRGGKVFNRSAPVIKLPAGTSEEDHLALLGLLNSSTACFWMKQVFHCKGRPMRDGGGGRSGGADVWAHFYEFDVTKIKAFPVVDSSAVFEYARIIDSNARSRTEGTVRATLDSSSWQNSSDLARALRVRRDRDNELLLRMVAAQEELDWLCYRLYGIDHGEVVAGSELPPLEPGQRPFEITLAQNGQNNHGENGADWFRIHRLEPCLAWPETLPKSYRKLAEERRARTAATPALRLVESPAFKRRWYKPDYETEEKHALEEWLADRIELAATSRNTAFSLEQLVASLQDDARVLAVCEVLTARKDFNLSQLVATALQEHSVPNHRFHVYKAPGLVKRDVWERNWADQRREDAGVNITPEIPPSYAATDFLKPEYWQLRGKLDVPNERFIAFTEVPRRSGVETLYGWTGWTAQQRVKAILAIDEELEDASVPLADRIGLLDGAWRLLPEVAREDAAAATRLKAELQALVGPEGPSAALIEDWKKGFPPPNTRVARVKTPATTRDDDESETEESAEV